MAKLAQVIRGIKITQASEPGARHNQHLPITPELLRDIKHNWQKQDITEDKIMLWAAFTTCFFGFLRSGELCCQNSSFDSTSDLAVNDVTLDSITNPQVIRIHLKVSKTDPFREGTDIYIARTGDDLCPVAALLTWLVRRGIQQGPLFHFQRGLPLTRPKFVTELRQALKASGTNPENFSGHNFRSGAATTASSQGISDAQIKLLGRWRSSAYQRYIKPSSSQLARLSSRLSGRQKGPNKL